MNAHARTHTHTQQKVLRAFDQDIESNHCYIMAPEFLLAHYEEDHSVAADNWVDTPIQVLVVAAWCYRSEHTKQHQKWDLVTNEMSGYLRIHIVLKKIGVTYSERGAISALRGAQRWTISACLNHKWGTMQYHPEFPFYPPGLEVPLNYFTHKPSNCKENFMTNVQRRPLIGPLFYLLFIQINSFNAEK